MTPRHTRALTLVEVLIAMAILVTVGASSTLMFRGVTRAWRTGELRAERYQQARLLFDVFSRELVSAVANEAFPFVGVSTGPSLWDVSARAEVFFTGTLPGRTGLVERGYWVNEDGDLLCHDEEPADGDVQTGKSEICGRDVQQFTVTYFDGDEWLDHWNLDGRLPKAVHIVLSLGRQTPEMFETVIAIPTS